MSHTYKTGDRVAGAKFANAHLRGTVQHVHRGGDIVVLRDGDTNAVRLQPSLIRPLEPQED